ncbi:hypothetical protein D3C80_1370430 [compost metagenome]
MHPSAQFQADIVLEGDGVGANLHLLVGGDARVRPAQIRGIDTAAGQQCVTRQAFCLEDIERQRDSVEGGEVGVEHGRFQPWGAGTRASCVPNDDLVGTGQAAICLPA